MSLKPDDLPSDLASAQAALLIEREALRAEREARLRVEVERDAAAAKVTRIQAEAINWQADAANTRAKLSDNEALIAHLELRIEKLKHELYGQRSERTVRLIESWNWSSKNSSPPRARMSLPRRPRRRRPRPCAPSRASDRCVGRNPPVKLSITHKCLILLR